MEFTQSGVPLSFEVTFDNPSLFVGLAVFDDSGVSPIQVGLVIPMLNFSGLSYRGKFTPTAGKSYVFNKSVYTDGTYTTIDPSYPQGSESIRADDIAGILLNAILNNYQNVGSVGEAIKKSGGGGSNGGTLIGIIRSDTVAGNVSFPGEESVSLNSCCASVCQQTLYQSADTPLNFRVTNCDGSPFNVSAASEIWVMFPVGATQPSPPVILKLSLAQLTIDNGGGGEFSGIMSQANALLLKTGLINVEIRVTIGSKVSVAEVLGQLTVTPSLFPGY